MMMDLGGGARLAEEEWAKVEQPVLIGIGEKDKMVTLEESQTVAQLLPNGELVRLEGMPHPIDRVAVDQLAAYIQRIA